MQVKNVIRGKHNKTTGKMFETLIDNSCKWYSACKVAKIEKQQEPMRVIKPLQAGKFVACYSGKSGVDYKGTIKGGKAIVFEAKHTDTDKITRDRVKEHQLSYMIDHYELGAEVYILISFSMKNFYRIPLEDWVLMKAKYKHLYLKEDEIQAYKLRNSAKCIFFLEGVDNCEI